MSASPQFLISNCYEGCEFKWFLTLKLQMSPVKFPELSQSLQRYEPGKGTLTIPTQIPSPALYMRVGTSSGKIAFYKNYLPLQIWKAKPHIFCSTFENIFLENLTDYL